MENESTNEQRQQPEVSEQQRLAIDLADRAEKLLVESGFKLPDRAVGQPFNPFEGDNLTWQTCLLLRDPDLVEALRSQLPQPYEVRTFDAGDDSKNPYVPWNRQPELISQLEQYRPATAKQLRARASELTTAAFHNGLTPQQKRDLEQRQRTTATWQQEQELVRREREQMAEMMKSRKKPAERRVVKDLYGRPKQSKWG